ncbi:MULTISPECIES: hypothetical protein [unclassified Paenibacillus]|uniref:hypothetical protein n=1 Tax=unclassified Paenibacillus TaxID=185978 RepID=UPI00020D6BB1|nr:MULTISPECIES: hypothetical protein [unclassified Paenibacillus]EGL17691.1 hypothetical protein HMPREF9413_4487 [Paenibacillus sp. HGF7]EPD81362.1 hypothetical protein HMPREF1207_05120 [Paenibacillus sp. HGH0039]
MLEISRVADTLVNQAAIFNCTFKKAWKYYMHPALTENFSYEDIVSYINEKMNLGQEYLK